MELYTKGTITTKTIQTAVSGSQSILESSISGLDTHFSTLLNMLPNDLSPQIQNQLQTIKCSLGQSMNLFKGLETEHHRLNYLKRHGLVLPTSFKIGRIETTKSDGGRVYSKATAEYVSIIDTLTLYIDKIADKAPYRPQVMQSFADSSSFKTNSYYDHHPNALRLILYHDDIEVGNALGSRAGVHKLTMFYIVVDDFNDGKLNSIHLCLVSHASDLNRFGYGPVLAPLFKDLEQLYQGVSIKLHDGTEAVIHAVLQHIAADNLAANQIMGLNRSFSKGHYCRFCYVKGNDCATMVVADQSLLRSATNHQLDVEFAEVDPSFSKRTGVRTRSALDHLSYFSLHDSTVPDLM